MCRCVDPLWSSRTLRFAAGLLLHLTLLLNVTCWIKRRKFGIFFWLRWDPRSYIVTRLLITSPKLLNFWRKCQVGDLLRLTPVFFSEWAYLFNSVPVLIKSDPTFNLWHFWPGFYPDWHDFNCDLFFVRKVRSQIKNQRHIKNYATIEKKQFKKSGHYE